MSSRASVAVVLGVGLFGCAGGPRVDPKAPNARVVVQMRSDNPGAELAKRVSGSSTGDAALKMFVPAAALDSNWEVVCKAPCGAEVDRNVEYRVQGSGIVSSTEFALPPERPVVLDVSAGSALGRLGGELLLAGGAIFAIGGSVAIAISEDKRPGEITVGVSLGVMVIGGLILYATQTRVSSSSGESLARRFTRDGFAF